jgi:hypothetical protein
MAFPSFDFKVVPEKCRAHSKLDIYVSEGFNPFRLIVYFLMTCAQYFGDI